MCVLELMTRTGLISKKQSNQQSNCCSQISNGSVFHMASLRWKLAILAEESKREVFLLGATMWVKFQPSKVYIVKFSCDEDMVNTRNLSLKGTLFLQQKAGDSSEISTAELLNLNLLRSVL